MMNWKRIDDYHGKSGLFNITEAHSAAPLPYTLYFNQKWIGSYATKDEAKAKAEEMTAGAI